MYNYVRLLAVGGFAATFLTAPTLPAEAAPLTCGGKRVTIAGTAGDDTILGTSRSDVIHTKGGNDRVRGRGGNDLICGGYGGDRLWGGDGNDRLYGGPDLLIVVTDGPDRHVAKVGDRLDGGAGDDRLNGGVDDRAADPKATVPDILSWASSRRGVRVDVPSRRVTGNGTDRWSAGRVQLWLTEYDDRATGGRGVDRISTGDGDDVVSAGPGDDLIDVDGPADVIGAGGADVVRAGSGDDQVRADRGRDALWGDEGDDTLLGGTGVDRLRAGDGDDEVVDVPVEVPGQVADGGAGRDVLRHAYSEVRGGLWNMATGAMVVGAGTELVARDFEGGTFGGFGTWNVDGTEGPDDIESMNGATTFRGHGGDDTFLGSTFDDWFDGGAGTDTATGMRQGDDTCVSVEVVTPDCENVTP